ncbi:MAG: hypothetical protein ACLFTH_04305 [Candidatus Woesearchaeota archaeon]
MQSRKKGRQDVVRSMEESYPEVIAGVVRSAGLASEEMTTVIKDYLIQTATEGVNVHAFEDEA